MFMVTPTWNLEAKYSRAADAPVVKFTVAADDLETVVKTLRRSGFWSIAMTSASTDVFLNQTAS